MRVKVWFRSFFLAALTAGFTGGTFAGDATVGEKLFKEKNCHVCHGPGGKGMASYPKLSGKEVDYWLIGSTRTDQVPKWDLIQI